MHGENATAQSYIAESTDTQLPYPIENPTSRETTQMRDFSRVANDGGVSTEVQVLREKRNTEEY